MGCTGVSLSLTVDANPRKPYVCSVITSVWPENQQRNAQFNLPDSKVQRANMGPIWVLSAPDGPHAGPMNLAIRAVKRVSYCIWGASNIPEPLFTKRYDVLPQDLMKPWCREIQLYICQIALKFDTSALKFDRHLGSSAVEMPVKF